MLHHPHQEPVGQGNQPRSQSGSGQGLVQHSGCCCKVGVDMSPGISGDAGGLTLSSLSSSLWLSKCGERGSRGADMSGGTLKRSENLA